MLIDLIPLARRPNVAVIILTRLSSQPLWELAKKQGAYGCFLKKHTAHEDLDKAIQRAIALVGLIPKEDNVTANGIRVEKISLGSDRIHSKVSWLTSANGSVDGDDLPERTA